MPLITVALTTADTVYPASATSLLATTVAIQAHRDNTAAVFFSDSDAPATATKTGIEFVAPVATLQNAILGLGGSGNQINLSTLKFVSASNTQKMIIYYRQA